MNAPYQEGTDAAEGSSVARIASRLFQWGSTRLELLAFELEEEKRIVLRQVTWLGVAAAAAFLGAIFLPLGIILFLPPEWRGWGGLIIGFLYLGLAFFAFQKTREISRERPSPFSATVAELQRDQEWLKTLK